MSDDPAFLQRQWLESGFTWLDENWPEDQLWRDVRVRFLDFMGVTDDDIANSLNCRALGVIVQYVDGLTDVEAQRSALLTAADRDMLRENAIMQWAEWVAAASAAQPGAPEQAVAHQQPDAAENVQYFDGYGWMRVDPATNQWVPTEAPPGAATPAAEPAPAPATAAEPAAAPAAPAEPAAVPDIREEDREELDAVVRDEIAPLISEALADVEGSELLTQEEIQAALAEALQRLGSN